MGSESLEHTTLGSFTRRLMKSTFVSFFVFRSNWWAHSGRRLEQLCVGKRRHFLGSPPNLFLYLFFFFSHTTGRPPYLFCISFFLAIRLARTCQSLTWVSKLSSVGRLLLEGCWLTYYRQPHREFEYFYDETRWESLIFKQSLILALFKRCLAWLSFSTNPDFTWTNLQATRTSHLMVPWPIALARKVTRPWPP